MRVPISMRDLGGEGGPGKYDVRKKVNRIIFDDEKNYFATPDVFYRLLQERRQLSHLTIRGRPLPHHPPSVGCQT